MPIRAISSIVYTLIGGPLAAAGLVCSCLCWQNKPKTENDLKTEKDYWDE